MEFQIYPVMQLYINFAWKTKQEISGDKLENQERIMWHLGEKFKINYYDKLVDYLFVGEKNQIYWITCWNLIHDIDNSLIDSVPAVIMFHDDTNASI